MMAACDFVLMPSRYEACGLPQMIGQIYGAIPIVAATGGLAGSVRGIDEGPEVATGFLIPSPITASRVKRVLFNAILIYRNKPDVFRQMQHNAMGCDFRWSRAVDEYEHCFQQALDTLPYRCQKTLPYRCQSQLNPAFHPVSRHGLVTAVAPAG